ncbi:hypothetical protein [Nostoc sp.]|uniref:hypothetical protein n=1 Tax=Nostoc sp. TaxID=1180 RepID=UPI002FF032A4
MSEKAENIIDFEERLSHLISIFEHNGFYLETRDCGFRVWKKVFECESIEELSSQVNEIVGDND